MNKPEDMFDIIQEDRDVLSKKDESFLYKTKSWYLIYKSTGEKHFPKTRKYGYSHLEQAKIARTRLFNDYVKSLEKYLLE